TCCFSFLLFTNSLAKNLLTYLLFFFPFSNVVAIYPSSLTNTFLSSNVLNIFILPLLLIKYFGNPSIIFHFSFIFIFLLFSFIYCPTIFKCLYHQKSIFARQKNCENSPTIFEKMLYHKSAPNFSKNFCRYFVQFYTSSRPSQVSLLNCIQLYNFFIKLCTIKYFLLNCVQLYNISYQIVYNLYSDLYKKYSIFKVRFFVLFLFCLSFHFLICLNI